MGFNSKAYLEYEEARQFSPDDYPRELYNARGHFPEDWELRPYKEPEPIVKCEPIKKPKFRYDAENLRIIRID